MGVFNPGDLGTATLKHLLNEETAHEDRKRRRRRFGVTFTSQDSFVGALHVFQGQVVNDLLLKVPFFFLPVFLQPREKCLPNSAKGEPNLIAAPVCSPTVLRHRAGTTGEIYNYRIYVDLLCSDATQFEEGIVYTLEKPTGMFSVMVSGEDRVGIGDIVFVTSSEDPRAIQLYVVEHAETTGDDDGNDNDDDRGRGEEGSAAAEGANSDAGGGGGTHPTESGNKRIEMFLKPYERPNTNMMMNAAELEEARLPYALPDTIGLIGWVDTGSQDIADAYALDGIPANDSEKEELCKRVRESRHWLRCRVKTLLERHRIATLTTDFWFAGVAAPIRPRLFADWKSVINTTVLLTGNVSVVLNSEFYRDDEKPWCGGDFVEMQLGAPRDDDLEFRFYNSMYTIEPGCVRLEVRFCRPHDPPLDRWQRLQWRNVVGRFIVEEEHPNVYGAQIALTK